MELGIRLLYIQNVKDEICKCYKTLRDELKKYGDYKILLVDTGDLK